MVAPQEFDRNKIRPIEVVVEGSSREDFEYAFRKFNKLFNYERIIGQLKERSAYEKPSQKKRRKYRESIARQLKADRREQMMKTGEWDRNQKKKVLKQIQKAERTAEVYDD